MLAKFLEDSPQKKLIGCFDVTSPLKFKENESNHIYDLRAEAKFHKRILHYAKWCLQHNSYISFHHVTFTVIKKENAPYARLIEFSPKGESEVEITINSVVDYQSVLFQSPLERELLDSLDEVVAITEAEPIDEPGPRFLYFNKAFERMTGHEKEESIGKNPRFLQSEETSKQDLVEIKNALKEWRPIKKIISNKKSDGRLFNVELNIRPVQDKTGWHTHWISIQRDVSHQVKEFHNLETIKNLFTELEQMEKMGVWKLDVETKEVFWSKQVYEILGVDPSIPINIKTALSIFREDYQGKLEASIQEAVEKKKSWDLESVFKNAQNEYKCVRTIGRPVENKSGEVKEIIGTIKDISQEKLFEKNNRFILDIRKRYIGAQSSKDDFFHYLLKRLLHLTGCHYGLISELVVNENRDQFLKCYISGHRTEEELELSNIKNSEEIYELKNILGESLQSEKALYLNQGDYQKFSEHYPPQLRELDSLCAIPLHNDEVIGLIVLGKKNEDFREDFLENYWEAFQAISDVIFRLKLSKESKEMKAQAEMIVETLELGTWSLNLLDYRLKWAETTFKVFELPPDDFNGEFSDFKKLVHPDDFPAVEKQLNEAITSKRKMRMNFQFRIITPDQKIKHLAGIGLIKYSDENVAIELQGINWDISKEVEREQELKEAEELAAHRSKLASIGEMAAGIGHEINNPLTIAQGYLKQLEAKLKEKDYYSQIKEELQAIRTSHDRIVKVSSELRNYSRIDNEHESLIDLSSISFESIRLIQELFSKEGIALKSQIEQDLFICGIKGYFQQILTNLLLNAKDAMIGSQEKFISIRLEKDNSNNARLVVLDNGPGIPLEIKNKIFNPFFTTKKPGEGTGIGLGMVKRLVNRMKGEIEVENDPDFGACFTVTFPLVEKTETSETEQEEKQSFKADFGKNKCALILDDEEDIRELVSLNLEDYGFQTVQAENAFQALNLLQEQAFDIVISDMIMPELNGLDFIRRAKKQKNKANPKFIILSGGISSELENNLAENVIEGIIEKPFTIESLLEGIDSALKR